MREPMQAVCRYWFWIYIPLNPTLRSGSDVYYIHDIGRCIKDITTTIKKGVGGGAIYAPDFSDSL